MSKKIKKCIREKKENGKTRTNSKDSGRTQRHEEHFEHQVGKKKRILIPKVKNRRGEVITARKGIANVFAEFDTKLYEDGEDEEITRKNEAEVCGESERKMPGKFEPISEFTTSEIQETAVGSEQNRSKMAAKRRKKR